MKDKALVFYSLLDFYPKRDFIKDKYNLLTTEDKYIYKMYVYSLPWTNDDIKDLMWEYINGWNEGQFELAKKYREKKEQNKKRQEKYDKENKCNNTVEVKQLEFDYWAM